MDQVCDPARLLELHKRLLKGDRTASEEIASLLLSPLANRICRKFPFTDEQIVADGVTDAVLDYCENPQKFDATRGVPLDGFIHMAARRNVSNLLRGEKRRKVREEKYGRANLESSVELSRSAGNLLQKDNKKIQVQRPQVEALTILKDKKDQQIHELRLQGERRTQIFAQVLQIDHLPTEVQRREVKRAKDRIDKVLERYKRSQ